MIAYEKKQTFGYLRDVVTLYTSREMPDVCLSGSRVKRNKQMSGSRFGGNIQHSKQNALRRL